MPSIYNSSLTNYTVTIWKQKGSANQFHLKDSAPTDYFPDRFIHFFKPINLHLLTCKATIKAKKKKKKNLIS